MSNPYHTELTALGRPLTAENLLDLLRGKVAPILSELLPDNHTPSMSARIPKALEILHDEILKCRAAGSPGSGATWLQALKEKRRALQGQRAVLWDFNAVHRAVWILEGRAV